MRFIPILLVIISLTACSSDNGPIPTSTPTSLQLAKTGQTITYQKGDDGDLQKGVSWPDPRFVDTGDGTVTDKLTGLVWLQNTACIGKRSWADALAAANSLASGSCGLSDTSRQGEWRLPNINELNSLVSVGRWNPAIGAMLPTGSPIELPFSGVGNTYYWSSTTLAALDYQA